MIQIAIFEAFLATTTKHGIDTYKTKHAHFGSAQQLVLCICLFLLQNVITLDYYQRGQLECHKYFLSMVHSFL